MMCQNCNQKEANVHITKIINGVKSEAHLCEDCAKHKQELNIGSHFTLGMPMSFQNILEGFVEAMDNPPKYIEEEKICAVCGITFDDFRKTGRLGCGNCYNAFNDNMLPLVRRIHGNIQHTGKVPRRTGGILKVKRDIEKLRDELKLAVNREEYEKAARLRDEIRKLESDMNQRDK